MFEWSMWSLIGLFLIPPAFEEERQAEKFARQYKQSDTRD